MTKKVYEIRLFGHQLSLRLPYHTGHVTYA
jgi:hypothetical protein